VKEHPGFKGGLDASYCKTAPYYTDIWTEVIFHAPCLINQKAMEEGEASMKKLMENNFVHVRHFELFFLFFSFLSFFNSNNSTFFF